MFSRAFNLGRRLAMFTCAYGVMIRPRILRWGSTDDEATRRLPGDDLVPRPRYQQTHAISIEATSDRIWPWLVQMGQGRAGMYGYERLERLSRRETTSADRIVPEFQHLAVGDAIRLLPEAFPIGLDLEVAALEPGRMLVFRSPASREEAFAAGLPVVSWSFVLEPIDALATRLIVRTRSDYRRMTAGFIWNGYGLEPIHFLMERQMLLGLRDLAERFAADQAPDKIEVSPGPGSPAATSSGPEPTSAPSAA